MEPHSWNVGPGEPLALRMEYKGPPLYVQASDGMGLIRSPGTFTTRSPEPSPTLLTRMGLGADSPCQPTGSSTPVLLPMPEMVPASPPTQMSNASSTPLEPMSSPAMSVSPVTSEMAGPSQPQMGLQMQRIRRSLDLRLPELSRLTQLDMGRRAGYQSMQEEEEKTPEAE